jgi:Arc/MetJ-type ribon-helix-helix transcriptional regulator
MAKTSEIKVRLDDDEERILARLVKEEGVNRSEVLRRSLRAYEERRREDAALEKLMAWADADEARGGRPPKARFRME